MSKHTPGPWSLVNGYNIFSELGADSGDGYKAPGNDGWLIATVELGSVFNEDGDIVEISHGAARANAHLIAAAPELLDALELALEYWRHRQQRYKNRSPHWVADALAAIAKARGEKGE